MLFPIGLERFLPKEKLNTLNKESTSLNKYISSTGMCSRREADKLIESGRVMLNDEVAKKGNRVFQGDQVIVDGKSIKQKRNDIYLMLNKPPGITCTTDLKDKDNIIDFINHKERIFPIGRLDKASSGLILLTNDGDIVNRILRKENSHEKEYVVTVNRPITKIFMQRMSKPMTILGTKILPAKINQIGQKAFKIILVQGLNRQIRRMCEQCDFEVRTLKRIRIMHLDLADLAPGKWRYLSKEEFAQLQHQI